MSSYLFIVKYELPEVIRAFLGLEEISGWVRVLLKINMCMCVYSIYSTGSDLSFNLCAVFTVNGTWTGTTWWCLCRLESFCLCLSLKIWVRTHFTAVLNKNAILPLNCVYCSAISPRALRAVTVTSCSLKLFFFSNASMFLQLSVITSAKPEAI